MGRIRTKDIKAMSKDLVETYPKNFTKDFVKNKETLNGILDGMQISMTKRKRNRIAGYVTRLVVIGKQEKNLRKYAEPKLSP